MYEDKGTIRIAVVMLIIVLVIIYAIANQQNKPQNISTTQVIDTNYTTTNTVVDQQNIILQQDEPIILPRDGWYDAQRQEVIVPTEIQAPELDATKGVVPGRWITKISNQTLLAEQAQPTGKNQVGLAGTNVYLWDLASLKTLGVSPQYILDDIQKNIYYALVDANINWSTLATRYNGSIKEIVTQAEIQANQLRWNKITYINLPQYASQLVLMVVEIGSEEWFIQVDYSIYHTSKQHMKQRFQ